jgi:hypothetical protein
MILSAISRLQPITPIDTIASSIASSVRRRRAARASEITLQPIRRFPASTDTAPLARWHELVRPFALLAAARKKTAAAGKIIMLLIRVGCPFGVVVAPSGCLRVWSSK